MRLFAAVLPPDAALAELGAAVAPLHALPGADRLRWTGRGGGPGGGATHWHCTLAFMGEVEDRLLPELRERLGRAAHRTDPFTLRIHGGGRFDGKVLWAGTAGNLDMLRLLAERADAAARRSGVPMSEHRKYSAHLTLARSRVTADLRPFAEALGAFEGTPWEVAELSLVRSNLPVSGMRGEQPRYEVVEAWPLGG
ncbi:RNA 2',3'-cyclic phosphodiesterase [Streptomyces sp. A3M-1-3]|uniref:RNA 2',3'-cyclic phosphodiesterase n=1 Tax=Streptomyces sp. A3M-1-3 TaxID=2962044 RepID=UPI0020B88235|nr:RNA 2',3'-cyclic phosphodiesterase [Streptomyces sp. A3M-1-3]MCP3821861.1 RNA 2',3'-cyclic phosphodiesterase [Streptomyces sp. A3M-1-3]